MILKIIFSHSSISFRQMFIARKINWCRLNNGWDLSSQFCPCSGNFMLETFFIFSFPYSFRCGMNLTCEWPGPEYPISVELHSWEDYYNWRRIPLDSPVALLLHWVWAIAFYPRLPCYYIISSKSLKFPSNLFVCKVSFVFNISVHR